MDPGMDPGMDLGTDKSAGMPDAVEAVHQPGINVIAFALRARHSHLPGDAADAMTRARPPLLPVRLDVRERSRPGPGSHRPGGVL
jgi:hypothetical protein